MKSSNLSTQGATTLFRAGITEISASSTKSFDDAIQMGIKRANEMLKNVGGTWIRNKKVVLSGTVTEYQVTIEVTFVVEE
jgi:flavin-binding protein dodecin